MMMDGENYLVSQIHVYVQSYMPLSFICLHIPLSFICLHFEPIASPVECKDTKTVFGNK